MTTGSTYWMGDVSWMVPVMGASLHHHNTNNSNPLGSVLLEMDHGDHQQQQALLINVATTLLPDESAVVEYALYHGETADAWSDRTAGQGPA